MYAYIDLANLRSYAKSGGNPDFPACTDMLRQNFNIRFTFEPDTEGKETGSNEHHDPHKTIESQPR